MKYTRRDFVKRGATALAAAALVGAGARPLRAEESMSEAERWARLEAPEGLTQEDARAIVMPSHFNYDEVRRLVESDPRLVHIRLVEMDEAPIEAASHVGNREIAEYLLGRGARFSIHCAAMLGMLESVSAFLDSSPELAVKPGAHGLPLMYHAAHSGNIALLELLAARGGGQDYSFALHSAAEFDNAEVASWLLAQGADTEAQNFKGLTPLAVALDRQCMNAAAVLRQAGAAEPPASES